MNQCHIEEAQLSETDLISYLNRIAIFEWRVVRSGSQNAHQRDMCSTEIGLNAQNLPNHSRLNSKHYYRDLYDH